MSGLENMVSLAVTPIVTPNNSLPNNVLSDFGVTTSEKNGDTSDTDLVSHLSDTSDTKIL